MQAVVQALQAGHGTPGLAEVWDLLETQRGASADRAHMVARMQQCAPQREPFHLLLKEGRDRPLKPHGFNADGPASGTILACEGGGTVLKRCAKWKDSRPGESDERKVLAGTDLYCQALKFTRVARSQEAMVLGPGCWWSDKQVSVNGSLAWEEKGIALFIVFPLRAVSKPAKRSRADEAGQLAESLARLMPASLDAAQHQDIREEVLRQVVTGGPIARIEAHLEALGRGTGAHQGQAPACGVSHAPPLRGDMVDAQLADCFRRTPLHLVVTTTIDSWPPGAPPKARQVDPIPTPQHRLHLAQRLLALKPDLIRARNNNGATPLHTAACFAEGAELPMFEMLLGRAPLEALVLHTKSGWLVLHTLVARGHRHALKMLLLRLKDLVHEQLGVPVPVPIQEYKEPGAPASSAAQCQPTVPEFEVTRQQGFGAAAAGVCCAAVESASCSASAIAPRGTSSLHEEAATRSSSRNSGGSGSNSSDSSGSGSGGSAKSGGCAGTVGRAGGSGGDRAVNDAHGSGRGGSRGAGRSKSRGAGAAEDEKSVQDTLRRLIFHINSRHYVANMRLLDEACAELGLPLPLPPPPKQLVSF